LFLIIKRRKGVLIGGIFRGGRVRDVVVGEELRGRGE